MAGKERFEDSIGTWLEEAAPNRLPGRVLDATFERTRRTRQDAAWRTAFGRTEVPRFIPALGGAAVVVLATILALNVIPLLGPAAPSAPPSPSPSSSRFSSSFHGFSIDYPSEWRVRPATTPWAGGELAFDSPAADVIFKPAIGEGAYVVVASQRLGAVGVTEWTAESLAWLCSGGGESWAITIDEVRGQAYACTGTTFAAIVATGGRGYLIRLVTTSAYGVYDFETWLKPYVETIDLRPEAAVD